MVTVGEWGPPRLAEEYGVCTELKRGDWKRVFSGLGKAQLLRLDDGGDIWPGRAVCVPCTIGCWGDPAPEAHIAGPVLLLLLLLLFVLPPRLIGLPPVVVKTPRYEILLHPF